MKLFKKSKEVSAKSVNRKAFLNKIMMPLSLVLSYGTGVLYGLRYLMPKKKPERFRRVYITSMKTIEKEGSKVFNDLSGGEVVLVKSEDGLKAISTRCTHLGCKVFWEPQNNRFFCPCHIGIFDVNGNVMSGPPPAPLPKYDVEVDENENVFVSLREVT
ncbi:MAG: Rieske (2Fe-2S) protein [Spirochaetia bacterium]|nr:Rieske (2Fe-2S) protein [Spirochaetia bacterium]